MPEISGDNPGEASFVPLPTNESELKTNPTTKSPRRSDDNTIQESELFAATGYDLMSKYDSTRDPIMPIVQIEVLSDSNGEVVLSLLLQNALFMENDIDVSIEFEDVNWAIKFLNLIPQWERVKAIALCPKNQSQSLQYMSTMINRCRPILSNWIFELSKGHVEIYRDKANYVQIKIAYSMVDDFHLIEYDNTKAIVQCTVKNPKELTAKPAKSNITEGRFAARDYDVGLIKAHVHQNKSGAFEIFPDQRGSSAIFSFERWQRKKYDNFLDIIVKYEYGYAGWWYLEMFLKQVSNWPWMRYIRLQSINKDSDHINTYTFFDRMKFTI